MTCKRSAYQTCQKSPSSCEALCETKNSKGDDSHHSKNTPHHKYNAKLDRQDYGTQGQRDQMSEVKRRRIAPDSTRDNCSWYSSLLYLCQAESIENEGFAKHKSYYHRLKTKSSMRERSNNSCLTAFPMRDPSKCRSTPVFRPQCCCK